MTRASVGKLRVKFMRILLVHGITHASAMVTIEAFKNRPRKSHLGMQIEKS